VLVKDKEFLLFAMPCSVDLCRWS